MTNSSSDDVPMVPLPSRTLIVDRDGTALLTISGLLALPLGARIEMAGAAEVTVVGVRLVDADLGTPSLVLDVEHGGSSLDHAAVAEAEAELQVVEAAEEITAEEAVGPV